MIVYFIRHILKNKTTTHHAAFLSTQNFVSWLRYWWLNLRSKTTKHCRTKATGSFSSPGLRKWSWVSSQAAFDYLDFAIRFLGHPEWSLMISGVTKVTLTCRRSQTDLLCQTTFCLKHEAPNIGLWGSTRSSATAGCVKLRQLEQLVHIVKGDQPERRVLDRIGLDRLEGIVTLTLPASL